MKMSIASTKKSSPSLSFVLIILCLCLEKCFGLDIITSTEFIKDPEAIVSNGKIFRLGFFSPVNTTNRYVGIMYNINISATTVVWVANRDKPLNDSSGIVVISEDGNLVVLNGKKQIIWSSNVSSSVRNSSAQLLDTGDLVLRDKTNGKIIWESFDYPTDSFLQAMRISTNVNTGEKKCVTSWRSPSNPSIGSFSVGISPLNIPQLFVWNGSCPYWRSGPWNGQSFIGITDRDAYYFDRFDLVDDKKGSAYFIFIYVKESVKTYLVLNPLGIIQQRYWYDGEEDWKVTWSSQENECDIYGICGPFGICNSKDSTICSCLQGFEPKNMEEWSNGNWINGCIRRTPLKFERNTTLGGKEDGFLQLGMVKVPDFAEWVPADQDVCRSMCLSNCSCIAYAFEYGIGCMQWSGSLIDIHKFSNRGVDLYIRVAYSEVGYTKKEMTVVIAVVTVIASLTITICTYLFWRWLAKENGNLATKDKLQEELNLIKFEELPLFSFEMIANATNNFDLDTRLGQGGFGPVYKGRLADKKEVAVKRLSRFSGQGLEEFMNEVQVISKLQHRNLVRLLGCCIEGEEKMLIYEYMPNKSLDAFLFGSSKRELLDWRKRADIIQGIGRGLLYLHRDSRLRIIHRDLKASNILLDEELNPKISDFGMARIFGGNQHQEKTRRVVGTYGYMAPEYAMKGIFSEKSDIYSFGVLILEIVSGRKNTSFYQEEIAPSLLEYAWKLWNKDQISALIDPIICDPGVQQQIMRYIHVGMLCVQELPQDRPMVSTVLSMLTSEIAELPSPQPPAYTIERLTCSQTMPAEPRQSRGSNNNLTITVLTGR